MASGWDEKWSSGDLKFKGEIGSGGTESPSGESERKSDKGVAGLGEMMEGVPGEGPDKVSGTASPEGTAETVEVTGNDGSITEDVEDEDAAEEASSRHSGSSRRWTIALALLHTSQRGSGHSR